MKQIIQNGYIKGKFEKNLPLFALAQKTEERYWHFTKGKLPQVGTFNITVREHIRKHTYLRGRLFPVHLAKDEKIKDVFLKLQRVIKAHVHRRDYYTAIPNYLKQNGFGFLELEPHYYRHGYLKFKLNIDAFKMMQNFSYITKIADEKSKPLEVLESKKFKFTKYSDFLDDIYGDKLAEVKEYKVFEFFYIYESVINGYNVTEHSFDGHEIHDVVNNKSSENIIYQEYENFSSYYTLRENLKKFFDLKSDVKISKLEKVDFKTVGVNFKRMNICTDIGKVEDICSTDIIQFFELWYWLWSIKSDDKPRTVEIGYYDAQLCLKSIPYGENFYFILHERGGKKVYIEGVFNRNDFADLFLDALDDFLKNGFGSMYWRDVDEWELEKLAKFIKYAKEQKTTK